MIIIYNCTVASMLKIQDNVSNYPIFLTIFIFNRKKKFKELHNNCAAITTVL